jgi:putative transposase
MMNIFALFQPIQNNVFKTALRQLSRIIVAMIAMTGWVTTLGISRWAEKGSSYRTVQRFFHTVIPWPQVFWAYFRENLLEEQDTYLLAGDECVVSKAGDKTQGWDYFFSSLIQKAVPGLSFFTLALICTRQRRCYPVLVEQMIRTEEEKAASRTKKQAQKTQICRSKTETGTAQG